MLVALDSNVIIAALSPHEAHAKAAQSLAIDIANGRHQATISSIAYGEVLAFGSPGSDKDLDLDAFFARMRLATLPADNAACLAAGRLRQKYGTRLKLPDAIHLASALNAKVDVFLTNDLALAKIAGQILPAKTLADWQ